MRRIVLIATGLVVLVAAGVAYGALNSYTAKYSFTSKKAGTPAKPAPIGYTVNLSANGTNGNRSAVLLDLKTTLYGIKANLKDFPTCSGGKIAADKNDNKCPKGALVATGYIHALVGDAKDFSPSGKAFPCDPGLDVWNSGGNTLTFFFVSEPAHNCNNLGLKTGATPPYPGRITYHGKNMVLDVPIPKAIDFPLKGLAGSLQVEHLVFKNHTTKAHGKTVNSLESIGCKGGKRPWAQAFTATLPPAGPARETKTVTGSSPCS